MSHSPASTPSLSITEHRLAETICPSSEATSPAFAVSLRQVCLAAIRIINYGKQQNRSDSLASRVAQGDIAIQQRYGGETGAARVADYAAAKSERMGDTVTAAWDIILGREQLKAMGYSTEAAAVITNAGRKEFMALHGPETPLEQRNTAINHFFSMAEHTIGEDSRSAVAPDDCLQPACTQLDFGW